MIVRRQGASQLLVTQPDHAALAATIIGGWLSGGFPDAPGRSVILHAVREHDNGWRDVDVAPLVDVATGRLLDFISAPDEIRQSIWPRGIERLAATPYAAALVAQHALHIYRRYRGDRAWDPFFEEMEASRDRSLRSAAPLTMDDLRRDYFFVRVGDLASLTFCNGWTEPQTDDAGPGYTIQLDGTRLTIAPDPFGGREIPLVICARELPDRPFRSTSDAQEAFASAPTIVISGVACGRTKGVPGP